MKQVGPISASQAGAECLVRFKVSSSRTALFLPGHEKHTWRLELRELGEGKLAFKS